MRNAFDLNTGALNSAPGHWARQPLWTILRRRDVTGRPDAELLSVYRDHGVVPKNSREDNFNKPGGDLSAYRHVRPRDLVLNKMKTWQGSLGVSWHEGIVSPAYYVCELSPTVDARFIHHLLRSQPYISLYQAASKGIRPNQWDLPFDEFRKLPALLPPIEDQRRIADFLDAETARIDKVTSAARRGLALLEERRWATIFHLSTGAMSHPRRSAELGWLQQVPAHWPVVPLKMVASLGSGHTPSRTKPEYWQNCTIPWISLFDVGRMRDPRQTQLHETQQKISQLGMANSSACLHPAGTVVLSRTASVGFSTIMPVDMAVSQHFVTWTCGPSLLPKYLLMLLRSMRQYFESVQVGTTNVTVFMPDLYSIKIPLPPLNEQLDIVEQIDKLAGRMDALAEGFSRQAALLSERRQVLITAAVTGQFDVSTASGRGVTEGVSA